MAQAIGFPPKTHVPSMILELLLGTDCPHGVSKSPFSLHLCGHATWPDNCANGIWALRYISFAGLAHTKLPQILHAYFRDTEQFQKPHNVDNRVSIHLEPWITARSRVSFPLHEPTPPQPLMTAIYKSLKYASILQASDIWEFISYTGATPIVASTTELALFLPNKS